MEAIRSTQNFAVKSPLHRLWREQPRLFPEKVSNPSVNGKGRSEKIAPNLCSKASSEERGNRTCYMGLTDWRDLSLLPLENNSYMFCDLRGAQFDNLSLSGVTFFACHLDGTSFRGTTLHNVQFIGCFSSEQTPPTDFEGAVWLNSDAKASHLNVTKGSGGQVPRLQCWPVEVVEAANKTLCESERVREQAVTSLGKLGYAMVAPYLANLLLDQHWKVRLATVRALGQLREHAPFPHQDESLLKWLFLALGDKHPKVRHTTRRLIKKLQPSTDLLRLSIQRMRAPESSEKLAGLYAAAELCKLNYSALWELETIHQLLSDPSAKVRAAALSLLKMMDNQSAVPWVLETLSDEQADVRAQAIRTLGWIAGAKSASYITPLLSDEDEEVRIRALYTLRNIGQLQANHVAQVLTDDSPALLRAARDVLDSWNGAKGKESNGSQ